MAQLFLLAIADETRRHNILRIERRRLRDASDPLDLPEKEFVANFRLSKTAYQQVVQLLKGTSATFQKKNCCAQRIENLSSFKFLCQWILPASIGVSVLNNLSQSKVSKCLTEVINAFNKPCILEKFIKFPGSQRDRENIMKEFMEKFGFPGVIGCIDGTHVALIRPTDREEAYFNRKNYHSINVLIICDVNLNILHVDASYGGAPHDSYVWNQCQIKIILERLYAAGERGWLLDSGYAQRPWMTTPILGAGSNTPEEFYTKIHCRVRKTVERCIGNLKARCLLAHRVLHYEPLKCGKIVNACVVLHNIANAREYPVSELNYSDLFSDQERQILHETRQVEGVIDRSREVLVERLSTKYN